MWELLVLLCLSPLPGSGVPPTPAQNESGQDLQTPGASPGPPATPTLLPIHSEAPALLLNLGLNFQVKMRSQGKGQPPGGPTPPRSQPAVSAHSPAEGPGGSAGAGRGEDSVAGPTVRASNGSFSARAPPVLSPSATPLRPWAPSRDLELQVDMDLSSGLAQERGLVLGGGGSLLPVLADPHLPGLRLGIASRAGHTGLFGFTLPPELWKTLKWNITDSPKEESGDPHPMAEWTLGSGPAESSGSPTVPMGSEEAFAALPNCPPEACGSPRPEPGTPPLLPGVPLFVPLNSDWGAALAAWGPAWEAHVYGAGALSALLAGLALLGLLALPCRRRPRRRPAAPEGCLLALLHLLLLAAGGTRAGLLFDQAEGQRRERLPGPAQRLLLDLPLPCLSSALATALVLLWRRPRAKLSARPSFRPPCLLALLLLGHFSAAAGAVLASERLPVLLLAARGLFALLAALLSAACLGCCCRARGDSAQIYDLRSDSPPAGPASFVGGRRWSRAACTASPAAAFGLLSAGLHAYSVLHALGYGLRPALFGPWPWWTLQLACRLCEAGLGLPLAAFGLCLTCGCSAADCCRCLAVPPARPATKPPLLPSSLHWALSQHEKLMICDSSARGEPDYLPLSTVRAEGPINSAPTWSVLSLAIEAGDPTADFQPPSPIDLRRSIDEALCSEGLLRGSGAFSASSLLSLGSAPENNSSHAISCLELPLAHPHGTATRPSFPASHGSVPQAPPAPGDPCRGPAPVSQECQPSAEQADVDTAFLHEEPVEVSRQADALSLGSDTINL